MEVHVPAKVLLARGGRVAVKDLLAVAVLCMRPPGPSQPRKNGPRPGALSHQETESSQLCQACWLVRQRLSLFQTRCRLLCSAKARASHGTWPSPLLCLSPAWRGQGPLLQCGGGVQANGPASTARRDPLATGDHAHRGSGSCWLFSSQGLNALFPWLLQHRDAELGVSGLGLVICSPGSFFPAQTLNRPSIP